MKPEREKELFEIMREILHKFCPYEKSHAYQLLERLRALETNIERDNGEKHEN